MLRKPILVGVLAACVSSLLLVSMCYVKLRLRVAFAADQVIILEYARQRAVGATSPTETTSLLEYTLDYYPSGTKQVPGSRLDHIVETVRSNAVREALSKLRTMTGADLGDNPTNWLQRYPPARP